MEEETAMASSSVAESKTSWSVESKDYPLSWTEAFVKLYRDEVPDGVVLGTRWTVPLHLRTRGRARRRKPEDDEAVSEEEEEEEELPVEDREWRPWHTSYTAIERQRPRKKRKKYRGSFIDEEEEEEEYLVDLSDGDGDWRPEKRTSSTDSEDEIGTAEEEEEEDILSDSDQKSTQKLSTKKHGPKPKSKDLLSPVSLAPRRRLAPPNKCHRWGKEDEDSDGGLEVEGLHHRHLEKEPPSGPCKLTKYKHKSPVVSARPSTPTLPAAEGDSPLVVEPGDFLLELTSVQDGYIPHVWCYKRAGLIQKYVRVEEKGVVLYQNCLSFCDWCPAYSQKFVKIEMEMTFKYRTFEKLSIKTLPDVDGLVPQTVGQLHFSPDNEAASAGSQADKEPPNASEEAEEGVSSTTGQEDAEFQPGMFVMDKKDLRNVDNFAIWRIESGILLKKYQMQLMAGKMVHKPVRVYRGYRNIFPQYVPIKIKPLSGDYIEVEEESRPKLFMDSSTEEKYEKNPLLRHFYVYLQVFLSQALEPGFLKEIYSSNDVTFTLPLTEIDRIIEQKMNQIERKIRLLPLVQKQLQKHPYLREVAKPDPSKGCQAIAKTDETVEEHIFLFGDHYDLKTLQPICRSQGSHEFAIGKTAAKMIGNYHQLCHFKYNLYDRCLAKVKVIRESKEEDKELDIEQVMDECMGNKHWVLQNFETFMSLIQK